MQSLNGKESKITIILADDHKLFRKAIRDVLHEQKDFQVVAEAENGVEAVDFAIELTPDIVIMDISMPVLNGLEATRKIKDKCPQIATLVLTIHDDIEFIIGILEAGAAGYLTKNVSEDEIVIAIRSIMAGETVIATPIFQQVLQHSLRYSLKPLNWESKDKLTAREMDVLKLAAMGYSNKQISQKLNLSLSTVKFYMIEIFTKLNVSSRTEAVITALRARLINPQDLE